MPGYRAHITLASMLFLVLWAVYGYNALSAKDNACVAIAMLWGALMPDCDTRSVARMILHCSMLPISVFLIWYRMYMLVGGLLGVWLVSHITRHRSILHTLWFPSLLVFGLLIYVYAYNFYAPHTMWPMAGFMLGYLSHLWLDGKIKIV